MNPAATNWAPGVIVLLLALAAGVVMLLKTRAGTALPSVTRTRRDELTRQKDALYTLLREHKGLRGAFPEDAWTAERDRLELEAARVLRDLDQLGDAAPAPSSTPSFGQRNPRLVGALWGAGAMLFLGALGLTLQEFTKPRAEGGSITGGGGMSASSGEGAALSPAQEARLAELRAAAEGRPDDADARNAYGHALLHAGKLMESFQEAEAVVKLRPGDPEARTHQAIVLIAIGDVKTAASALDKVVASAPEFAEALAYRGALHFQAGEAEQAIAMLERASVADPAMAPSIAPLLEAARAGELPSPAAGAAPDGPMAGSTGSGSTGSGSTGSGPAGSGPMGSGGPTAGGGAPAAPAPEDVTGSITIDPAVADRAKPGDTLFLSARPPGVDRGPPTWVLRLRVDRFPMDFTIGPANAMLGGPAPAELVLTARIDRDGNAMTKSPEDLEGRSATLTPGTKGVSITLAAAQ